MSMSISDNQEELLQKELDHFLQLAQGEIRLSLKDSSESIKQLTKTFMEMVRYVHEISVLTGELNVSPEEKQKKDQILSLCNSYLNRVQEGTVGFQFYDKLTQRLTHTSKSLQNLVELATQENALFDQEKWEHFKDDLKGRYNTEKDRAMYDAIMEGQSIKAAMELADKSSSAKEGTVELF